MFFAIIHSTCTTITLKIIHLFKLLKVHVRQYIISKTQTKGLKMANLSLLGWDISEELSAYRWRLNLHKEAYFNAGYMQEYKKCLQLEQLLEKQ